MNCKGGGCDSYCKVGCKVCEWECEEIVGMGCSAGEWWVRMAGVDVSCLVTPHTGADTAQ